MSLLTMGRRRGAGQGHLGVGIFALEIVEVQGAGQGVLPEVGQPQQGRKGHPAHPAPKGALLGVEAVGPHPFMAHQVQGLVLVGIVCLLENGDIVGPHWWR